MPSFERFASGPQARSTFVNRLSRLIQLHRNFQEDLNPMGLQLLERSIDATYWDCVDFGAEEQARQMLARAGLQPKDVQRE
jgi:hypothetical protein